MGKISVTSAERLAKIEKVFEQERSKAHDVLLEGYRKAVEEQNEDCAAELARKIRDKYLEETDKEMVFDRMGLKVPEGTTFTAWLDFLRKLGEVLTNQWSAYRQQLRDLPEQDGFPFEIAWPERPDTPKEEIR